MWFKVGVEVRALARWGRGSFGKEWAWEEGFRLPDRHLWWGTSRGQLPEFMMTGKAQHQGR